MKFLKNLDYLLEDLGMSRSEIARIMGITPSTINSWYARNTDKIDVNIALRASEFFGVPVEVLVRGDVAEYFRTQATAKRLGAYATALTLYKNEWSQDEIKLIMDFMRLLKKARKK